MDPQILAALSPADVNFIKGFKDSLQGEIADGCDYGGLLEAISQHVDLFLQTTSSSAALADPDPPSWSSLVCTREGFTVRISGPIAGDHFSVNAKSAEEASDIDDFVSALDAACMKLKEIQDRYVEISRKRQELEEEQRALRQPAETTVDDHIRLLRQYNKTKDVGQQLIGLIAESRGLPLGTLYRNGDYGVNSDD